MRKALPLVALSVIAFSFASAVEAQPAGFRFSDLEFQQRRDPLLPSNQSADIVEHTPQADLAAATSTLASAVPAGTPRATAEAILRQAGARCTPQNGATETCTYFDVKTRDPYVDAVHWNVQLRLSGDQVSGMTVDRSWTRDL